ncbi:Transmembrane protein [Hirschfeldia incana]|nr:Transmembrane protein [Hirschfeldia incana]
MDLRKSRVKTTTVTLSFLLLVSSFYTISTAKSATNPPSYQLFLFVGFFLAAALSLLILVTAARATMVAWITVIVLLAFSGTRRRVLANRGKTITTDVAMSLVRILISEADPRS